MEELTINERLEALEARADEVFELITSMDDRIRDLEIHIPAEAYSDGFQIEYP
jgi:hypothetical protein